MAEIISENPEIIKSYVNIRVFSASVVKNNNFNK
jgi:hypothetical protein